MSDILDELRWRGLVAQTTDEAALREALADGPITFYCGFDPTAPSLHMGNLVQLITMRHLQRAGHRALCLVGGSTGLIGDPKATAERQLNDPSLVADWVARIQAQVRPFLDFEGDNPAVMVNNLDWTAPISALEFLRDIGKHFRVNTMIRKDAVAARLASDDGISYTEFSYQILQGLDYLQLFRQYGCTLQTGGTDQWGNLTAGVDLIHRAEHASVHLLTTPLVTKADGTKFGKTESGTVWLDASMMSPYAFYQFWLNADDASVLAYIKIFTDRSREEVAALEVEVAERPFARQAQRTLATDVTTLVHGASAAAAVEAASQALFGRGSLDDLDPGTLADATAELDRAAVVLGGSVVDAFVDAGLAPSRSGARRTIDEGGAYVNNVKVTDPEAVFTTDQLLHGRFAVLRRGKKSLAAAVAEGA
ncbi:tyrosine--tRNA ligase [Angustibacter sp. McL0619]|uniref:tyrosine--tRNA ligase n=1 Tax=Angustibacter sp. McL0619 TaxID=3415676 RepID=UPI003CE8AF71